MSEPGSHLTTTMLGRLTAAGCDSLPAASELTVDERDRILGVAAWGGSEDAAWTGVLSTLADRDRPRR